VRAFVATGLLVAAAFVCLDARAAPPDTHDPGALFDKGLAEMQAHQYATGCPALAESYRLDPHAGGLFTLAECESEWGKIASAIADYDGFLDLYSHLPAPDKVRQRTRANVAAEKRTALAREVPRITLTLDTKVATGSTVTLDGKSIPGSSMRSALPVDPGDHVATLLSPDGRKSEQHVTVAVGETRAVMLTLPPIPVAKVDVPTEPAESTPEEPAPKSSRNSVVFVTGGVGAAALVAGGVLGAIVLAQKSSIDSHCPNPQMCDSVSDANSANSARTLGWISTGVLAAGGAAVAAAVILRFTWPKTKTSMSASFVPAATGTGGVAGLGGVW
jgi:hypothetical protein